MIKSGTPINPNSKNEKPVNPFSTKALLTIILGGVPVNVSNPPVLDPNATGISNLEGSVPAFQAAVTVTGSNAATVPVLLTKPDKILEPRVTITNKREMFLLAHFTKNCPAMAVHPVLESPSPMIKRAAIIITVGLLNPAKVSLRSKIPVRKRESMAIKATTSGGNLPQTNNKIVIPKIISSGSMLKNQG
tara:strand:- start:8469 stop:9038 length:570 start_codon:yes stop_codon:yes gene_type:complete